MEEFVERDVSMKETAISIRRGGKLIWRGKCASDPKLIAQLIHKHAPVVKRVVFETGPLAIRFDQARTAEGFPTTCIGACHTKAALDMVANKSDANDADGQAHLAEVGFSREVRVEGFDSMLARRLVAARNRFGEDHNRALEPNPRAHEDIWFRLPPGQGKPVRAACSRISRR
jgi:transposase